LTARASRGRIAPFDRPVNKHSWSPGQFTFRMSAFFDVVFRNSADPRHQAADDFHLCQAGQRAAMMKRRGKRSSTFPSIAGG